MAYNILSTGVQWSVTAGQIKRSAGLKSRAAFYLCTLLLSQRILIHYAARQDKSIKNYVKNCPEVYEYN